MLHKDLNYNDNTWCENGFIVENSSGNREYCGECGKLIGENEDTYECRTHAILCEDCLKMLHKRYV